jgi:hypothetical protein
MSDPQTGSTKAADPLDQWRELRDTYIDIWAKASGEAVNSEAYAQASGTMLEAFLSTSSPFRDAQKKAMISALEQFNMPSRDDYVRLAERLSNLELLLDDMDARLRQIHQLVARAAGAQPSVAQPPVAARPPVASQPSVAPAASKPSVAAELFAASKPSAALQPSVASQPSAASQPLPQTGSATKSASKPAPRGTPAKISRKGSK